MLAQENPAAQKQVYTRDQAHELAKQYLTEVGGKEIHLVKSTVPDEPHCYIVYDEYGRAKKRFFCR